MFSASKLVTIWEWELMSTHAEIVSTAMTDLSLLCKAVYTFNGVDADGTITKGGYFSHIVVLGRYELNYLFSLSSNFTSKWPVLQVLLQDTKKLSIGFGSSSTLCWNYCLCSDGTP